MFSELLTPVTELDAFKELIFTASQLGSHLKNRKWDPQNPPSVALLGIPEGRTSSCLPVGMGPNSIRKQLYSLSGFPNHFDILDLGNIKNGKDAADTFAAVKMIAEELWLQKIPLLILGGSQDLTQPLLSGIQKPALKLTVIDDRIDNQINENSANDEIYINNLPFRTSIHIMGCQTYFIEQNGHDDIRESFKGHVISLGELRSDIREMEPVLRESDLVSLILVP
jgi:hypothetical protein